MTQITSHLADISARVTQALNQANRPASTVRLVAVSKKHAASAIREAVCAGVTDVGENIVAEALEKIEKLRDLDITWHFLGTVQGNKTRQVAENFDWVQSIDRLKIARRLSEQRPAELPPLQVLIQVNQHAEPQKGGIEPAAVAELAAAILELPRLRLRGLMCIPPAGQSVRERQASFTAISRLAEQLRAGGLAIDTLSMGMSDDFETAILAGATCIRIGTALFGARRHAPD